MVPTYYILLTLFLVLSLFLVLLVLLQKGRGGGLASAFGGVGGNTAFGAKTGDVLTWATSIVFAVFVILAIVLNLIANSVHESAIERVRSGTPAAVVDPANVPTNIEDLRKHSTTTSPTTGSLFPDDPTTKPATAPAAAPTATPTAPATTVPAAASPATAPASTQP
jgi:preprotein translocase subunit SecG